MPDYSSVLTEIHNRIGLVRLNRPQAMNALNSLMLSELGQALAVFDGDDHIGAIVITGSERAFAAGADIKELANASVMDLYLNGQIGLYDRLGAIRKPVIGAVSGFCLGGGFELALSCDMIIASETARFGLPETTLGVIPGAGGTQRLTRAVGKAIAMEVILNNRLLSAEEALHFGLINHVVPVERCLDEALEMADEISARAPLALRLAKEAINGAFEVSMSEGLAAERRLFYLLFASQDQKEGMAAFLEKRKAVWKGQ